MGEYKDPYVFLTDVNLQHNPEEEASGMEFNVPGVFGQN